MRSIDVDGIILGLAQPQHGIVARWQLVPAGVPFTLIDERVKRRRLELIVRRVYRVPGIDGPRRDILVAVFTFGPCAVASHHTAGLLHGLLPDRDMRLVVSTWRGHPDRRDGIGLHRVHLPPDERTTCDGVPVTSLARTLLDLAGVLSARSLEQAVARALRVNGVTEHELLRFIARYPRRTGSPRLRAILSADEPPAMTRSEAEDRFLALIRNGELPPPQVNAHVHGFELDFYWRAHAVAVEIDGMAYHATRSAQQRDRRRDSTLGAGGIRVMRFTWTDLTTRPHATLVKVAQALGRTTP